MNHYQLVVLSGTALCMWYELTKLGFLSSVGCYHVYCVASEVFNTTILHVIELFILYSISNVCLNAVKP